MNKSLKLKNNQETSSKLSSDCFRAFLSDGLVVLRRWDLKPWGIVIVCEQYLDQGLLHFMIFFLMYVLVHLK